MSGNLTVGCQRGGSVALLVNPNTDVSRNILNGWASHVLGEKGYGKIQCLPNENPIIKNGLLQIPWPCLTTGGYVPLDMLLATVTNPELVGSNLSYPSVSAIAKAWLQDTGGHVKYFWCNRKSGILKFQDQETAESLGSPLADGLPDLSALE